VTDADRSAVDAVYDFTQLLGASSRSTGQRERLRRALDVPVTAAGLQALRIVLRHDGLTIGELGKRLDVDQSTISRQVRPLEDQGLLLRVPDPDDGRISRLTVSPQGAAVLARVEAVTRHDFEAALANWSDDDRARLAELVDRLRRDLLGLRTDDTGWSIPGPDATASALLRTRE
jgi:DNA-binding MarR family transcriptional regulator